MVLISANDRCVTSDQTWGIGMFVEPGEVPRANCLSDMRRLPVHRKRKQWNS